MWGKLTTFVHSLSAVSFAVAPCALSVPLSASSVPLSAIAPMDQDSVDYSDVSPSHPQDVYDVARVVGGSPRHFSWASQVPSEVLPIPEVVPECWTPVPTHWVVSVAEDLPVAYALDPAIGQHSKAVTHVDLKFGPSSMGGTSIWHYRPTSTLPAPPGVPIPSFD